MQRGFCVLSVFCGIFRVRNVTKKRRERTGNRNVKREKKSFKRKAKEGVEWTGGGAAAMWRKICE